MGNIILEKENYVSVRKKEEVVDCYYKDTNRKFDFFINEIKQIPAIASLVKELKDNDNLKVILSKVDLQALKEKKNFLKRNKKGYIMPFLFDEKGRRIEKQIQLDLNDLNILTSIDRIIVQRQLGQLINKIQEINDSINKILNGQQNDRVGLAKSAKHQYLEAMNIFDTDIKQGILLNAIKTAHDARSQLIEDIKCDINKFLEIPERQFNLFIKQITNKNYENESYKLVHNIHRSYEYINITSGILALAYIELEQPQNIRLSFKPYREVLNFFRQQDRLIGKLAEIDDRQGMEKIWKSLPNSAEIIINDFEKEYDSFFDTQNSDNIVFLLRK